MSLRAGREGAAVEISYFEVKPYLQTREKPRSDRQKMSFCVQVSGCVRLQGMPRKVMVVGYFAEIKGVVGCHYRSVLVFKVRDLKRMLN